MSKTRCANTVPMSVAHVPFRLGSFRVSTATRASSPILPGRTAFANRPTENAEKTRGTPGCGSSMAEWMTVVQATARATTERRLSAIATTTHSQRTARNASPIAARLSRRHQSTPATAARKRSPSVKRATPLSGRRSIRFGSCGDSFVDGIGAIIVGGPVRLRSPHDREIVRLALPALGAPAAEPLYVLADTAIVGHLGRPQIAALGVAGTVLAGSFTIFNFLTYGTTAVVARASGAGRQDEAARLAAQALWASLGIGVALLIGCEIVAAPLLRGLGGHGRSGHYALIYFRIAAAGLPAALVALAGQGCLRGGANLRRPLEIVVVANVVNLVLEVLFVYGFGWGIAGSPAGTAIDQPGMGAAFVVELLRPYAPSRRPSCRQIRPLFRVGRQIFVRT